MASNLDTKDLILVESAAVVSQSIPPSKVASNLDAEDSISVESAELDPFWDILEETNRHAQLKFIKKI